MNKLYFVHALDGTTSFLSVFKNYFKDNFFTIEPNEASVEESLAFLKDIPEDSAIIFLGHGHSSGLYTPESLGFPKKIFVNVEVGNEIFNNKVVLLLSCNSSQFAKKLNTFKHVIGFGNIISSISDFRAEAEAVTGVFRDISEKDINYFNDSYCFAIINALEKYTNGLYEYREIPILIEFCINQKINETLLNKEVRNRIEIAKLLFEFRNEMTFY